MKFKGIEKKEQGEFITRYDLKYETVDGIEKIYEMISRDKDIKEFEKLHDRKPDAVVMIMHDATGEKVLINKEYRMAVGTYVFSFPAGIIEEGETVREAASRELREETGLHIDSIVDEIRESFSAVGFSNEKNVCVVGTASGEFQPSDSTLEEIEAGWYTREEVRKLLKTENFAGRTQAYCYIWSKE